MGPAGLDGDESLLRSGRVTVGGSGFDLKQLSLWAVEEWQGDWDLQAESEHCHKGMLSSAVFFLKPTSCQSICYTLPGAMLF